MGDDSQSGNAKRKRGTGGQGKYWGQEGRVRIVSRPILCDSLIPGVMPFVCVPKDAKNKHLKLFRAWAASVGHLAFKRLSCCKGEQVPV